MKQLKQIIPQIILSIIMGTLTIPITMFIKLFNLTPNYNIIIWSIAMIIIIVKFNKQIESIVNQLTEDF